MIAYLIVSSFFISALTLYFIASVLLKGLKLDDGKNQTFCFFNFTIFCWALAHMLWQLAETEAAAVYWVKYLVGASIFVPYAYFHFVINLTENLKFRAFAYAGYLLAAILFCLNFGKFIVLGVEPRLGFEFWPVPGVLFPVYIGGYVLMSVLGVGLLFHTYCKSEIEAKNKLRYILIGTAVGFAGGSTNFLLWFEIQVPPFGHGLVIVYLMGLGYTMLKYRILDFSEMAFRILGLILFSIIFGALCAVGLVLVLKAAYVDFSPSSFLFWWPALTLLSALLMFVCPPVVRYVDDLIQTRLISGRLGYRQELRQLSDDVVSSLAEGDVYDVVVERIFGAMSLDFASVYVRRDLASSFECRAIQGERTPVKTIESANLEVLVDFLRGQRHAIFLEEKMERSSSFRSNFQALFNSDLPFRSSDVFLPIGVQGSLYGFLVLGASRRSGAFSDVDLILLENLCAELALTIKSREMERMSNQVEKLVSLGTMAAGLSHELRNPLVSVRTMTSLLKKNPTELKLTEEFSATVQRDVKRIFGIVEGVSAFAQDAKRPMESVAIRDVIFEAQSGVSGRLALENVQLEVVLDKDMPRLHADLEQLIQVVRNIIENGINAISEWGERPELGLITFRASLRGGGRYERKRWLEMEISDNGPGISKDLQDRIFDPFATSRDTGARHGSAGTGLGLAIVSKIIERHQGHITVSSELNHGTCFRISLPCD